MEYFIIFLMIISLAYNLDDNKEVDLHYGQKVEIHMPDGSMVEVEAPESPKDKGVEVTLD